MKFIIERDRLFAAIQRVQAVVDKRYTIPVLGNLLFDLSLGQDGLVLDITATNLDIGMRTRIKDVSGDEGMTTLPAQKLTALVKELPSGVLTMTIDENFWATIEQGSATFRLAGLPATDFPDVPDLVVDDDHKISSDVLSQAITSVDFSVSHDESRYALTGVYWLQGQDSLRLVSTDGHRMSVFSQGDVFPNSGVIIPVKAISELKKRCGDDSMVSVGFQDNQAIFRIADTVLVARLIDATFPAYDQVIPSGAEYQDAVLDVEVVRQAVRRVSLMAGDSKLLKCVFDVGTLTLSGYDPNQGEASETIDCEWTGEPLTIGMNGRYVLDLLRVIDSERCCLRVTDPLSPGLFFAPNGQAQHVVMPMRVMKERDTNG